MLSRQPPNPIHELRLAAKALRAKEPEDPLRLGFRERGFSGMTTKFTTNSVCFFTVFRKPNLLTFKWPAGPPASTSLVRNSVEALLPCSLEVGFKVWRFLYEGFWVHNSKKVHPSGLVYWDAGFVHRSLCSEAKANKAGRSTKA